MKKIYIVIMVLIVVVSGYFIWTTVKNKSSILEIVKKEVAKKEALNECPGVTPEVEKLLAKNNIDLTRLKSNNNGAYDQLLGTNSVRGLVYASSPTGYTYKVTTYDPNRWLVLAACYNGRLVLTRDIRMSFTPDGTFRSAFDFDWIPIEVSPYENISLTKAKTIAYREQPTLKGTEPVLGYYDLNAGQGNRKQNYILAWKFSKGAVVILNAHTGEIIVSFNGEIIG